MKHLSVKHVSSRAQSAISTALQGLFITVEWDYFFLPPTLCAWCTVEKQMFTKSSCYRIILEGVMWPHIHQSGGFKWFCTGLHMEIPKALVFTFTEKEFSRVFPLVHCNLQNLSINSLYSQLDIFLIVSCRLLHGIKEVLHDLFAEYRARWKEGTRAEYVRSCFCIIINGTHVRTSEAGGYYCMSYVQVSDPNIPLKLRKRKKPNSLNFWESD